jgi:hypothetical protein
MTKPQSQSRREAASFELSFIPTRLEVASGAHRRFQSVADVEAVLWLHLGNELGLFDDEDAERVWNEFRPRFTNAMKYVKDHGISRFFSEEVRIFLAQLERTDSVSSARYGQRLSPELIDTRGLEMLFHEIGRQFRDPTLTLHIVFDTPAEWEGHFDEEPNADAILSADSAGVMNVLFAGYLRFIEHMGTMGEFFRQMEDSAESNFAPLEVERRIRAIHNWRLDLHNDVTRTRFVHLTATLLRNVVHDDELADLRFDASSLLARIPGGRRRANG